MKVRCINDTGWIIIIPKKWWRKEKEVDSDGPKYGDIVTVESQYWEKGILYYILVEWPDDAYDSGYEADCFVPIEEQYDKVSFERIKEKASVN